MRRIRLALAWLLDVLTLHGPMEALRRAFDALFAWAFRGWWP